MKIKINEGSGINDPWLSKEKHPGGTADKNQRVFFLKIKGHAPMKNTGSTGLWSAREVVDKIMLFKSEIEWQVVTDKQKYRWRDPMNYPVIELIFKEKDGDLKAKTWFLYNKDGGYIRDSKGEAFLSALEIAKMILANDVPKGAKAWFAKAIEGKPHEGKQNPEDVPEIKKAIDKLMTPKQEPEEGPHDGAYEEELRKKKYFLKIDGKIEKIGGNVWSGSEKFSALDVAKIILAKRKEGGVTRIEAFQSGSSDGGPAGWQNAHNSFESITKALSVLGDDKATVVNPDKITTVKGIKVRIGSAAMSCTSYSPANSEKPFGNKHFDPFTFKSIDKGEWECNTEIEDIALKAIERFVSKNAKMSQNVVDTLIDVAKKSKETDPVHVETELSKLYRGSSREELRAATGILSKIDWSKKTNEMKIDGKWWYQFDYNGWFGMLYPVASWTDNPSVATKFARGGPALNYAGARDFQFCYETSPKSAIDAGGAFLNFDELYKLMSNREQSFGKTAGYDFFDDISGYKDFDQEILLMGKQGSKVGVDKIWVNIDKLTRPNVLRNIAIWDKKIHKQIISLKTQSPKYKLAMDFLTEWFNDRKHMADSIDRALDKGGSGDLVLDKQFFETWKNIIETEQEKITQLIGQKQFYKYGSDYWNGTPWAGIPYEAIVDDVLLHRIKTRLRVNHNQMSDLIQLKEAWENHSPIEPEDIEDTPDPWPDPYAAKKQADAHAALKAKMNKKELPNVVKKSVMPSVKKDPFIHGIKEIITIDKNGLPNTGDPEKDLIILEILRELGIDEFITF